MLASARLTNQPLTKSRRSNESGYKLDYWFADEGISGATPARDRPKFKELVEKIRSGETLVVSKIDRLGRDALDI